MQAASFSWHNEFEGVSFFGVYEVHLPDTSPRDRGVLLACWEDFSIFPFVLDVAVEMSRLESVPAKTEAGWSWSRTKLKLVCGKNPAGCRLPWSWLRAVEVGDDLLGRVEPELKSLAASHGWLEDSDRGLRKPRSHVPSGGSLPEV